MADEPVIIVDDKGEEHEFPAGFDPKRAADIVRRGPAIMHVGPAEMLSGAVGHETNLSDDPTPKEPDTSMRLGRMLEPLAHPQTLGDMTGLLIPGQVEGAIRTGARYLGALKTGLQERGPGLSGILRTPGRAYQALRDSMPSRMAQAVEDFHGGPPLPAAAPEAQQVMTSTPDLWDQALNEARTARTAPPAAAAAQPTGALSAADRATLVRQGYPEQAIAKIEAQMGSAPTPAVSHAPTAPAAPQMRGPRIQIGAEKVGRQAGMTKEAVREATGPVLDEAAGQASPILPKDALSNIIDKLKSLPPGGPEREAYVQAATSGKTKWQVENIRRTLEHLGLLAPVALASPVRDELLRLMSSHSSAGGE